MKYIVTRKGRVFSQISKLWGKRVLLNSLHIIYMYELSLKSVEENVVMSCRTKRVVIHSQFSNIVSDMGKPVSSYERNSYFLTVSSYSRG